LSNSGLTSSEEVKIDTFDMLIGDVGGFYALMWGLLAWLMADFEEFKKMSGVLGDFYSTEDPTDINAWRKCADTSDNKKIQELMAKELMARKRYKFEYCEYWVASCFGKACFRPCFKNCTFFKNADKEF
jgi:hypothetical protein